MKGYESTHLHSTTHQRRTPADPDRTAVVISFSAAPLPDLVGLKSRHACNCHRPRAWLRRPNSAQRYQGLQRSRTRCPQTGVLSSPPVANTHPRRAVTSVTSTLTSQSSRLRVRPGALEFTAGRQGGVLAQIDRDTDLGGKRASGSQAAGCQLETSQTLDHQPRPPIRVKKNVRTRLITYASPRSDWAIGFVDEVWWSRFALPRLSAWQDPDNPVRLVEQSWQKGDPDPKALACYGVLWQTGTCTSSVRDQMWLRFVTGRPVSAITTQFLDWCCERLVWEGKRNWLLIWDNARLSQEPDRAILHSRA